MTELLHEIDIWTIMFMNWTVGRVVAGLVEAAFFFFAIMLVVAIIGRLINRD
jgi:hypothetical protein